MSRLVMNMLQFEFGLIPTKVLKEQKAEYIQALNDTRDQQDESIFPSVMLRLHNTNLQSEINAFVASQETDVPQGVLQGVADDLTDRQRVILGIIHRFVVEHVVEGVVEAGVEIPSALSIAKQIDISSRTVQRELAYLQAQGIIRRVGADFSGHWEIIEK